MRFCVKILIFLTFLNPVFALDKTELDLKILKDFNIQAKYANSQFVKQIKSNISNLDKREFQNILRDGYNFVPILRNLISKANLPDSILYLAIVESELSVGAVSGAKAVGIWQFMEKTAKLHGLRIDEYVDERMDVFASTQAAISYLKELKGRFGKWYLALMAYNCGAGRLSKAIEKAGSDDIEILLDPQKKYLPLETRIFIRKILATAYMASENNFAAMKSLNLDKSNINISKISVPGGTTLMDVGDSIGISLKKMKKYNAHLKNVFTPPNSKNYHLYIPSNKKDMFALNFKPSKNSKYFYVYHVKKGDTLSQIASLWGIRYGLIKDYNNLANNNLKINQKLIIPTPFSLDTYKIKKGETLAQISKKFDIDLDRLQRLNNITQDTISVGDKIVIPR